MQVVVCMTPLIGERDECFQPSVKLGPIFWSLLFFFFFLLYDFATKPFFFFFSFPVLYSAQGSQQADGETLTAILLLLSPGVCVKRDEEEISPPPSPSPPKLGR